MAHRAVKKRKGLATGESIAKRLRTSHAGKVGSSPTGSERKTPVDVVHAKPLSFASAEGTPDKMKAPETAPKQDKGKKPVEELNRTTMKISLATDFMSADTIDKSEVFPTLAQFMLPSQQNRFQQAEVEDLDASVGGLSFMVSTLSYDIIVRLTLLFF